MRTSIPVDLSTPATSLVHTPDVETEAKESDEATPVEKKEDAKPSTKPSGQSIAQVAESDEDDDTEDGKGTDKAKKPGETPETPAKKPASPEFKAMLEFKKENRELKRMIRDEILPTMKEMREQLKNGSLSKQEAKSELDALAEKYELDPEFVKDLAKTLTPKPAAKADEESEEYLADIKDIAEDDKAKAESKAARIKVAISTEFDRVVADNPEYAKVAKKDVIQKLIMSNEEYQEMAMEDVLTEVYGVVATPGMDGYSPQGANHEADVDPKDLADKANLSPEEKTAYQDDLMARMNMGSRHAKK